MSWGQALHHRDRQAEVMDQPGLDPADHQRALHGLRRINAISRSSAGVFSSLLALPALEDHAPLSVLELACGGGDTAIDLERMASRRGVQLTIRACDLNPEAIRIARSNALQRASAVEFFVADALEDPGPERVDVVYCTLFAHHLDVAGDQHRRRDECHIHRPGRRHQLVESPNHPREGLVQHRQQHVPGVRQHHPAAHSMKDIQPQALFEQPYLVADGGVGDLQFGGCASEAAQSGGCLERTKRSERKTSMDAQALISRQSMRTTARSSGGVRGTSMCVWSLIGTRQE